MSTAKRVGQLAVGPVEVIDDSTLYTLLSNGIIVMEQQAFSISLPLSHLNCQ